MDAHDTDQVIEEELEKMSKDCSDMGSDSDTDTEENVIASNKKQENDLPESILAYFKASRTRVNTFEQLILKDIDDFETTRCKMLNPKQSADVFTELGFNSDEDPLKLKERIMSEIEEEVRSPCETYDLNADYDTEPDTYKDSERQFLCEWNSLEERLKKEEEQQLIDLQAEKEQEIKSGRKEEQKMKCRSEQFREELLRTETTIQFKYLEPEEEDGKLNFQLELVEQQELIKRLEEQIEEERQLFEEVKQEEQKRLKERCITAATKIQAAYRGMLVRRWSKTELHKRREEEKRTQEKKEEREKWREREEKIMIEYENERKRIEEEERHHRDEVERRRAEYEKAKQLERHRLESERKLEEQRRKEKEEATRINKEEQKRMKEGRVEEEMRNIQEEKQIQVEEKEKMIAEEIKKKQVVQLPEGVEKRRAEEEKRKIQEEEKPQRTGDELNIKDEEESPERIKQNKVEEVIRHGKIQEDEQKTREEKADENKNKIISIESQKLIKDKRVDGKRKRKEIEETNGKEKEEEEQIKMEIGRIKKEISKVQVEDEKERKDEIKKTKDETKIQKKEKQKQMDKRREEKIEMSTEVTIKRKEEEEKQKKMNKEREVENITLKQIEQLRENETGQTEVERNKLKQNDIEKEKLVLQRNVGGEIMKERSRDAVKDDVKETFGQRASSVCDKENETTTKWKKDEKFVDSESQIYLFESNSVSKSVLAGTLSSITGQDEQHCFLESSLYVLSGDTSERQRTPDDPISACLSDTTEHKRLAWIMNCTPWSKLSMQNKKKQLSTPPKRKGRRAALGKHLLPLPVDVVLKSGSWSSLKQVTSVTLEDLSGCSLSTLSVCTKLQSLTLRRCSLQALDGLNQCVELQHIDLQDNNISYVDCGGLTKLKVLLLGRNQLTSIHGLNDAVNLSVLQFSHNAISRISGLGSLKRLHRLTVDHNQLISTRGIGEAFTILHLDCSYNHLSQVEGLENCALLNTLDLRGNNLTEMPALENHVLLRELYLDDNSICSLDGLDSCWLPLLCCLSVPQNSINQLQSLADLVSLRKLDVSHNCLSDLKNIIMSLQGCTHLQELSIVDNPVQKENNWRSSVMAENPGLIKLNGEQTGALGKLVADSTQLWSFQALCQTHQDQIDSVLQRHCVEISSASSTLQAKLLVGTHAAELFQLAEEQRYAHEYGDSGVCETSNWDLAQEKTQHPAKHKTLLDFTNKCESPFVDHNAGCAGSLTQKLRDTQSGDGRYSRCGFQASRIDLRTVAVMVIQRRWREHRQKRNTKHLGTFVKPPASLSPKREEKSWTTKPKCLNKDNAAMLIQAAWRGYTLRKRLTRALMLAQLSDGDEVFEEVDTDEFFFDEEALENDWSPLCPDMSPSLLLPYSEQRPLPKPLVPWQERHKSACVQQWKPRQAWIRSEEMLASAQSQSPDSSIRMQSPESTLGKNSFSEKSEKILEEWGISSDSTAHLMLKRAQRMKVRKQQHQRKFPAGRGDVSAQKTLKGEQEQTHLQKNQRTYQWLQTQAMTKRRSSAPSISDHFLPEIDPEILNGRRVQLVAAFGYRDATDSSLRISDTSYTSPRNHQADTWVHSAGYTKKDVPSPQRVTLALSRKERISFRDNPVQLSGGWGGGKKRFKANKFK